MTNAVKIINPGDNHLVNIDDLSQDDRNLVISTNEYLVDVDTFPLTSVGGNLEIEENGRSTVTRVAQVSTYTYRTDRYGIGNLVSLSNIRSVNGEIVIRGNDALADIEALSRLTRIDGDLLIVNNPMLD